jgi:hypothetical protein
VGALPSVVYRIVAPVVLVLRLTFTVPENEPPAGLIAGVATVSVKIADATALSAHVLS